MVPKSVHLGTLMASKFLVHQWGEVYGKGDLRLIDPLPPSTLGRRPCTKIVWTGESQELNNTFELVFSPRQIDGQGGSSASSSGVLSHSKREIFANKGKKKGVVEQRTIVFLDDCKWNSLWVHLAPETELRPPPSFQGHLYQRKCPQRVRVKRPSLRLQGSARQENERRGMSTLFLGSLPV